ncbi:MAG TPA: polyhydroxyalkanoic acid system family protein [Bryobacteraceae bacterium]|nr:polyhydroxyalkanoic acid system family protein [Bryobacteraceae bacterium]
MRITISHNRPKQEMKEAVERSIDQLFTGFNLGLIEFANQRKEWSGDRMTFSLTAKIGFLQTPIQGWALVADRDVTLDVDLGLLNKLIPEESAKALLAQRAAGLLGK